MCWIGKVIGYRYCDGGKSLEHTPLPRSILKTMIDDKNLVTVSNPKWEGGKKKIGINGLGAKCLCVKHNSATHKLDEKMLEVWEVIEKAVEENKRRTQKLSSISDAKQKRRKRKEYQTDKPSIFEIKNCHLFERSLAKQMCNQIEGGNYSLPDCAKKWSPPMNLVQFILGEAALPKDCGVAVIVKQVIDYETGTITTGTDFKKSFDFGPVLCESNRILGCRFNFRGLGILFSWDVSADYLTKRCNASLLHLKKMYFGQNLGVSIKFYNWSSDYNGSKTSSNR